MKMNGWASEAVFGKRTVVVFLLGVFLSATVVPEAGCGQGGFASSANSRQIDPVRSGDQVEVHYHTDWYPGTVISFSDGGATVVYERNGRESTGDFSLEKMRFPNGEGQWAVWRDASGKFSVEARYIARDETSVLIRKEDGTELTIPIDELALDLRQRIRKTPITGEENKIDGAVPIRVGDRVQVKRYSSTWENGVVKKIYVGEADVDYEHAGRTTTKRFPFNDIRFPGGEGRWREWSDASGKFKVVARYISRSETHVTIRKENGVDLDIPIDRLSANLRRELDATPVTGRETLIDGVNPIRVGDDVQVNTGGSRASWKDGVIMESRPGAAMVEYRSSPTSSPQMQVFELKDVRYPNGEGHWRKWADESGSFEVVARYLKRNETHVTLMKQDGGKVDVPIDRLSVDLRRLLQQSVTVTPRPEKVEFAMAPKVVSFMSHATNFSQLSLPNLKTPEYPPLQNGGFGFQLDHGDSISAAIPTGGSDPWVAVGTFGSDRLRGQRLSRLYWTQPSRGKVVPGPTFQSDERIVDFSARQGRLITLQVTEGTWEQPQMFCSYRVEVGKPYAQPEAAWDIAEKKKSYGRGSDYKARLIGDHHLLLADGKAVSLYDFASKEILYTIGGVLQNDFKSHPSKEYFLVSKEGGGLSLHDAFSGRQVASESSSGGIGFSLDGSKLVRVDSKEVSIFDITKDAVAQTLLTRNLPVGRSTITMLDDDWIWSDKYLYNTQKEMVVWNYSASVKVGHQQMLGRHMLLAGTTSGGYGKPTMALVGVAEIPHEDVIAETAKVDADSMIMLKPGAGIKIEATGDPRVRQGLLQAVEANGWHEDANSEVVLKGSAQRGKAETTTYESSRFRFSFGRRSSSRGNIKETLTVTPWTQSVSISFRGKSAWSRGQGGVPYSLTLRDDETVASAVAKATAANYGLFEKLQIPAEMLYPQYRYGLGRTSITVNGFVDSLNDLAPAAVR